MLGNRIGWKFASLLLLVVLVLAACLPADQDGGTQAPGGLATEPGLMETAPLATEAMATEPMATEPMATEPMATEPVPETGGTEEATPSGADGEVMGAAALEVSSSPELGEFLVDGEGMTLYWFANDEPGVSNCTGGCLEAWPPFIVESEDDIQVGEGVDESLVGTIPFEGGGLLVTYDEYPLYYWQNDQAPGDTTGHGVNDVWFVVPPQGIDPENPGVSPSSSQADPPRAY